MQSVVVKTALLAGSDALTTSTFIACTFYWVPVQGGGGSGWRVDCGDARSKSAAATAVQIQGDIFAFECTRFS